MEVADEVAVEDSGADLKPGGFWHGEGFGCAGRMCGLWGAGRVLVRGYGLSVYGVCALLGWVEAEYEFTVLDVDVVGLYWWRAGGAVAVD